MSGQMDGSKLIKSLTDSIREAQATRRKDQQVVLRIMVGDPGTSDWTGPGIEVRDMTVPDAAQVEVFVELAVRFIAGTPWRYRFEVHVVDRKRPS